MRSGRWLTLIVFAICALAVVEGLAWITYQALRLERSEREARAQARFEGSIRDALWRMESMLIPLVAREEGRGYWEYRAFYPADRAYNRMWQELRDGEVLVPSPLLEPPGQFVRLHFQIEPDGAVSSPQAPEGAMRELAAGRYLDREFIVYAGQMLSRLSEIIEPVPAPSAAQPPAPRADTGAAESPRALRGLDAAAGESDAAEYMARQQAAEIANLQMRAPARRERSIAKEHGDYARASVAEGVARERAEGAVTRGRFVAAWLPDTRPGGGGTRGRAELFLRRTITLDGAQTIQGVWLDWPSLRAALLGRIGDLLPAAMLEPVPDRGPNRSPPQRARMLASIPIELLPGPVPPVAGPGFGPTQRTLAVTWLAVLAAIAAIGIVLRASMSLSDRRGRFVAAVTHELRTPLTTFCLYSEMLADGMVRDERDRRAYLATLKAESRRLARIVENVLDYARLGRRGGVEASQRPAPIPIGDLVERIRPALDRHAAACGMRLLVDAGADGAHTRSDPEIVERILFNLVDNACKYASDGEDKRLHLSARSVGGRWVEIALRDHGPGIPDQRGIFEPFHRVRPRPDGAQGRTGLGLGLALARGLARQLGGDLTIVRRPRSPGRGRGGESGGAELRLRLPAEGSRRSGSVSV